MTRRPTDVEKKTLNGESKKKVGKLDNMMKLIHLFEAHSTI